MRLTITELAPGGAGVAIAEIAGERRAVFVSGVALADEVDVAVDLAHRPARGRLLAVVRAGPGRTAPACRFVERCGGCDWMHLSAAAQAEAHAAIVSAALPPSWRSVPIATYGAPARLGYRARARVHVRASGGRAVVGMNASGTHEPVPVDECVVLHPVLERARLELATLFEGAHGRGDVQLALSTSLAALEVRWSGPLPGAFFGRLERGVAGGLWAGARVLYGDVTTPAIIGDATPWMKGADGAPLRLAPGGFAQASEAANAILGARVSAIVDGLSEERKNARLRVLELYAGAGNFTVLLARRPLAVTSVEASREACDAARANLAARGLSARVVEADAESHAWPAADLVLLDPPRTGARAVAERLCEENRTRQVIYVSCDPATLGRDLAILEVGYEPRSIATVEMFPQTSHVETVVHMSARTGPRPRRRP